jgi:hypothetical protein
VNFSQLKLRSEKFDDDDDYDDDDNNNNNNSIKRKFNLHRRKELSNNKSDRNTTNLCAYE